MMTMITITNLPAANVPVGAVFEIQVTKKLCYLDFDSIYVTRMDTESTAEIENNITFLSCERSNDTDVYNLSDIEIDITDDLYDLKLLHVYYDSEGDEETVLGNPIVTSFNMSVFGLSDIIVVNPETCLSLTKMTH